MVQLRQQERCPEAPVWNAWVSLWEVGPRWRKWVPNDFRFPVSHEVNGFFHTRLLCH